MQAARMGPGNFNGKQNKSELLHQPATPHTLKDSGARVQSFPTTCEALLGSNDVSKIRENSSGKPSLCVTVPSLSTKFDKKCSGSSLFFSFPFFPLYFFLSSLSLPLSLFLTCRKCRLCQKPSKLDRLFVAAHP